MSETWLGPYYNYDGTETSDADDIFLLFPRPMSPFFGLVYHGMQSNRAAELFMIKRWPLLGTGKSRRI